MDLITLTANNAAGQAQQQGMGGMLLSLLPFVLIFVVMWFFMIRPQKKKQKEEAKMRDNLQPGDEIMTIGGFYGRVISAVCRNLNLQVFGIAGADTRICRSCVVVCSAVKYNAVNSFYTSHIKREIVWICRYIATVCKILCRPTADTSYRMNKSVGNVACIPCTACRLEVACAVGSARARKQIACVINFNLLKLNM